MSDNKAAGGRAHEKTAQPVRQAREPASLTSGRASSLMGGMGGGRYICSTRRRSGEKDRLGSGGRSTTSRSSLGGVKYPCVGRSWSKPGAPSKNAAPWRLLARRSKLCAKCRHGQQPWVQARHT